MKKPSLHQHEFDALCEELASLTSQYFSFEQELSLDTGDMPNYHISRNEQKSAVKNLSDSSVAGEVETNQAKDHSTEQKKIVASTITLLTDNYHILTSRNIQNQLEFVISQWNEYAEELGMEERVAIPSAAEQSLQRGKELLMGFFSLFQNATLTLPDHSADESIKELNAKCAEIAREFGIDQPFSLGENTRTDDEDSVETCRQCRDILSKILNVLYTNQLITPGEAKKINAIITEWNTSSEPYGVQPIELIDIQLLRVPKRKMTLDIFDAKKNEYESKNEMQGHLCACV